MVLAHEDAVCRTANVVATLGYPCEDCCRWNQTCLEQKRENQTFSKRLREMVVRVEKQVRSKAMALPVRPVPTNQPCQSSMGWGGCLLRHKDLAAWVPLRSSGALTAV